MNADDARRVPTLILRGLAVLGMVAAVAAGLGGAFMVLDDMSDRGDVWDGLGAFVGMVIMGGAVLVLAALGPLYFLLARQPRVGLWVTLVTACVVLVGIVFLVAVQAGGSTTVPPWDLAASSGAGALVVAGLAAWGLVPPSARVAAWFGEDRAGRS